MKKVWTHKRIRHLLTADPDVTEQFVTDFGPVIYTWMYYQVGADAQIALNLTKQALSRVAQELWTFDSSKQTFFQWRMDQTKISRDEGLEHLQMKPQRPWAWSQLPDDILCGLSQFRCEILNDGVLSNPYVHEIIQSTIVELEPADQEILIHRFCHLDSEQHIAEEMNCSVEDIQNRLYKSRHSFRRMFFEIIAVANNGFTESCDTGDLDIQDTNLEKMLSTTTIYQPLDTVQMDTLREQLLQACNEMAKTLPKQTLKSPFFTGSVIIVAIIIILIAIIYWTGQYNDMESVEPPTPVTKKTQEAPTQDVTTLDKKQPTQDSINGEDLELVFALGKAGDLNALLEILKSGQYESQAMAAIFIGKLADPSAIELLEQAEEQWYPEPEEGNPFDKAIKEILSRFPEAIPPIVTDEVEQELIEEPDTQTKEVPESPVALPNIAGIISDISNQPINNIPLEVSEKRLFETNEIGKKSIQAQTNQDGQYQLSCNFEGPAILTARIGTTQIKQSLWNTKDSISIINMGGKPVLNGMVMIDGQPLSNQRLFLCDTLDIDNAAFSQEVLTDAEGGFSFLGIPAGVYSVSYLGLDNQIHRLTTVEMPVQDVVNVNLDISTASFTVEYPTEPNMLLPERSILVYTMDAPSNYYQPQATLTADGTFLFEAVPPGPYILKIQLDNGLWIQEQVEITEDPTLQSIALEPVGEQLVSLSGNLLGVSPVDLFLTSANQRVRINIQPNANGSYLLESIPADVYSLATTLNGQLIEFTQIDLQEIQEMVLDIDPKEMMASFSPLYVIVTDPTGLFISDAQVWLTSQQQINTTSSTGQGAFLAVSPGNYQLSVALPGYPTFEKQIELKASTLLASPTTDNTIWIRLGAETP